MEGVTIPPAAACPEARLTPRGSVMELNEATTEYGMREIREL
jgi:hypothetical protein